MRCLPLALLILLAVLRPAVGQPADWADEFPLTDFEQRSVEFDEILSGGPPRDGIPAIDDPAFVDFAAIDDGLAPTEPVLSLEIDGDARAYPFRVLIWHEIVNDTVGGVPVAVTYCPLCNSALVFERTVADRVLDFGTTGRLRHSDLVMYDRQTESWWQQFLGEAIIGELLGTRLVRRPARVESVARFAERFPDGRVLVPGDPRARAYGYNPYAGYDTAARPFLYSGDYDGPVPPLARVVAVGEEAWSLQALRLAGRIEAGDLVLTWQPGQSSPLDTERIDQGREIGNVVVQRRTADGLIDAVHDIPFAFAFTAMVPGGIIHTGAPDDAGN